MSTSSNQNTTSLRQRGGKKRSTDVDVVERTSEEERKPRYKQRKQLPSVSDLLAYGPEETRDQPKTWGEIFCLPVILAILFGISLLIFHHAPHHLSKRRTFQLPKMVEDLKQRRLQKMREQFMKENPDYHMQP